MHYNKTNLSNLSLRSWARSILGKTLIYFSLLCLNIGYAAPAPTTTSAPSSFYDQTEEQTPVSQTGPLTLSNRDMGLAGPLSFGMGYGSLDQFSVNAQYTKKISPYLAASVLGEYGPELYRYGATLGARLFENGFAKISAEQFAQDLPFAFASGDIDKFVKQNAAGARYQQVFQDIPFLKNFNGGVYYSNAPNVSLDPVYYDIGNATAINYRNIAGGTSQGADFGTDLHITPTTELSAQLYYDYLRYDVEFTEDSEDDAQGFGGGLGIKQILDDRFAISVIGSVREIYNVYTGGVSWLPPMLPGAEVSLLGQSIVSHNDTPDNNSVGLQLGYNFGAGGIGARYALSNLTTTTDVGEWTNTPAVYMEQVLAVSEEYSVFADPGMSGLSVKNLSAPMITAIEPISGPLSGAQGIVIKGTNFVEPISVTFDGYAAKNVVVNSATQITVDAPEHSAGKVVVQVKSEVGTSEATDASHYIYQKAPMIKDISQAQGPIEGGTLITIKGKNFTGATKVNFGAVEGTDLNVVSATEITVKSPEQPIADAVHITVVTPSGVSATSPRDLFAYMDAAAPVVGTVSPNAGPLTGGQEIIIMGTGFTGTTDVKIGGNSVMAFGVASDTELFVTTPVGAAGLTNVLVIVGILDSGVSGDGKYTYYDVPTVTLVNPNIGSAAGGESVTITGTNFVSGSTEITFNGAPATSIGFVDSMHLTATTPAGSGVAVVQATTPGGTSTVNGSYTYAVQPIVGDVTPDAGPLGGGQSITITGTGFTGATSVTINGNPMTGLTVGPTTITGTTPAGVAGTQDVIVTTPGGSSAPSGNSDYTYQVPPTVTGLTPSVGNYLGGTSVTISGTNFTNFANPLPADAVQFGVGNNATGVTIVNSGTITVTAPAGTLGATVDVIVTNLGGASSVNPADKFTYEDLPSITSFINTAGNNAGPVDGGDTVTITGTGFVDTTSVKFGTVEATSFSVNAFGTQIIATTPAQLEGAVYITVTTPLGFNTTSGANSYLYQDEPVISDISPHAGPTLGGNSVTITGTGFTNASIIMFGPTTLNTPADFTVNSDTSISIPSVPGHLPGQVQVTVTTPGGVSAQTDASTYNYDDVPSVTSVTPNVGPLQGGQQVTIKGSSFVVGATTLTFDGVPVTTFGVVDASTILATTPPGILIDAGTAIDVNVTTPGGTGIGTGQYTYYDAPTITSVLPIIGPTTGNQQVTIMGTGFNAPGLVVQFDSATVTSFVSVSSTTIVLNTPAHALGTVAVIVTTIGGTATDGGAYTYQTPPTITHVSPNTGTPLGGTKVIITGTDLNGATAVTFGGKPAESFMVNSATQITAFSPSGAAGAKVDIQVTTPAGVTPLTGLDKFTYLSLPGVNSTSSSDLDPTRGMNSLISAAMNTYTPKIFTLLTEAEYEAQKEAAREELRKKAKHKKHAKKATTSPQAQSATQKQAALEAEQKQVEAQAELRAQQLVEAETARRVQQLAEEKARQKLAEQEAQRQAELLAEEQERQAKEHAKAQKLAEQEAQRQAELLAEEQEYKAKEHAKAQKLAEKEAQRQAELLAEEEERKAKEQAKAQKLAEKEAQQRAEELAEEQERQAKEHAKAQKLAEKEAQRQAEQLAKEEAQRQEEQLAREEEARRQASALAEEEAHKAQELAEAEAKRQAQQLAEKDAQELARQEAEQLAKEQASWDAKELAAVEAKRQAQELTQEEERKAEQLAEEQAKRDAEQLAKENAAWEAQEQQLAAEDDTGTKAQKLAEKEAREEAKREAAQIAKEEAEWEAQHRQLADEDAGRKAQQLAEKEAAEEAKREAEQLAKEEAEWEAQQQAEAEVERKAQQLAEKEAAEQAKRDAEQLAKENAVWDAQEQELAGEAEQQDTKLD